MFSSLAAVITAGGQSRRFGSDKALAVLDGQTLLERVASSLEGCSPRLIIAPLGRYAMKGWQNVADTRPNQGPLAGLEAGLTELAPQTWTAFAAVDMPHLTPEFWATLSNDRAAGAQVVIGRSQEGRLQPLAALYHASALPSVTALLDAGERRMLAVLGHLKVVEVDWSELKESAPQAFKNVNRVEELG